MVGVFRVMAGVTFTIENLTIADGNVPSDYGGGVSTRGGTLIVNNSTLSGNSAALGGGISSQFYREYGATLTVNNSTFSGNSASRGGAILFGNSDTLNNTLVVSNSTFSGNTAQKDVGGGILIRFDGGGPLNITNCTFSGNSAATSGGAIQNDESSDPLVVANTILAGNTGGNCGFADPSAITDGGHNLDDGATCGFSAANGSLNNTDPQLDPAGLRDNGGPTQTIALQPGSPAIDAGNEAVCAGLPVNNLDQRGFARPGTAATSCSIGAYEYTLPGSSDCCQCPASCAVPVDGSCGDCRVIFDASCQGDSLCVRHSPTPTGSPTPSPSRTPTPTLTMTPTPTATSPSPTPTLGQMDCCQCAGFCAAPVDGTCDGCTMVRDASCTGDSLCVARTPTPGPAPSCVGDCSGNAQVTADELVTMVNITLGTADAASCPSGVESETTVTQIVAAVNNALNGCPGS